MDEKAWRTKFEDFTATISCDVSYEESAQKLRDLVKSEMLLFTDMRDNPNRFFEAHRLLLAPGGHEARGPGFGIRFTVQFNLFAGSILGKFQRRTLPLSAGKAWAMQSRWQL